MRNVPDPMPESFIQYLFDSKYKLMWNHSCLTIFIVNWKVSLSINWIYLFRTTQEYIITKWYFFPILILLYPFISKVHNSIFCLSQSLCIFEPVSIETQYWWLKRLSIFHRDLYFCKTLDHIRFDQVLQVLNVITLKFAFIVNY